MQEVHPEVQLLLNKNNGVDKKRSYDEYKSDFKIDLNRYNNSDDLEQLQISEGYLRHEELVLSELLPRTLMNQWVINNDYMERSNDRLESIQGIQLKQIEDINKYRDMTKKQTEASIIATKLQWYEQLNKTLK